MQNPSSTERSLAAILFTHIVGYTPLMASCGALLRSYAIDAVDGALTPDADASPRAAGAAGLPDVLPQEKRVVEILGAHVEFQAVSSNAFAPLELVRGDVDPGVMKV